MAIQADDAPDYARAMRAVERGASRVRIMDGQYDRVRFDKNRYEIEVKLHFEDRRDDLKDYKGEDKDLVFIKNLEVARWLTEDEIIEETAPRNQELNKDGVPYEARDYTTVVGSINYNWDLLRFILKTAGNVTVDGPKELRKRIIDMAEGLLQRTREVDKREEEAERRIEQYREDRKKNMNG